jgi:glutathione synthase/RimK-type ligase-like ATP-grasp enzyme
MRLAVLYEHPDWFRPLFAALERRGLPYDRLDAAALNWDPLAEPPYTLLLNRMSPSAYLRGHQHAVHAAAAYLAYVEAHAVPVVNGLAAYRLEISKAAQLDLFRRLGVSHPRSRVANTAPGLVQAARGLRFPVLVKPNIGGSGARIQRFDTPDALAAAAADGRIDLGIDEVALVQELVPAQDGAITRIELLGGELLYAIRIVPPSGLFNLCPADICRQDSVASAKDEDANGAPEWGACATKPAMQIEATSIPLDTLRDALAIAEAARLDLCGIEVVTDDRDGETYFYDVNALSNFVTDAPRIVGFDPFDRLARYLESRLAVAATEDAEAARRDAGGLALISGW